MSTRSLEGVRACLNRSVKRAMARDKVKRNVVDLIEVPTGRPGRPSKSLTAEQADGVLTKTAPDRLHPNIVVSLLTGARTEELRALRWSHVIFSPLPPTPLPPASTDRYTPSVEYLRRRSSLRQKRGVA